ncbi:unnamed protein product [Ambrosiozyma monospora]|uniref:Unnamed protein product n=1 Tax=Ambrosiozyma monospora TaxID=43982 RepID=A0ACB5U6A1_AMBMO|nr:unnamed protein product [Ambrosiozyma monospora]
MMNKKQSLSARRVWSEAPHIIKFKKVAGTPPAPEEELYRTETNDDCLESLGDEGTVHILQLLKLLHDINFSTTNPGASDVLFLNYKITAKLNRQLEEPLIVASGTLPDWCVTITRLFPFLFPIDTRVFFLKSTSFGYSRLIDLWQTRSAQASQDEGNSSPSSSSHLGRPLRHKLRISRKKLLQSAIKVMDTYGTSPGLLEIEYFDEAGTGLGPTLEFYANVSKEFSKSRVHMWRDNKKFNYATSKFESDDDSDTDSAQPYVNLWLDLFWIPESLTLTSTLCFSNSLLNFKMVFHCQLVVQL